MNEDGSEHLYSTDINVPVVNFGVSVLAATPGALIDPFVLGSQDENDVQGYAGTPTDVNGLTFDANVDIGAAGAQFPRIQRFFVSVDSRADPFTDKPLKGQYLLNSWVNDVTPPAVRVLTTRVTAGRPLIVAQAVDLGSGVDPLSLVLNYNKALVGASAYDPTTGLIIFGIPTAAPKFKAGKTSAIVAVSDYQESKNINTVGNDLLPNTTFLGSKITAVNGPTVTWIEPPAHVCALTTDQLVVVGGSNKKVTGVVFKDGGKRIGADTSGPNGVYSVDWKTASLKKGVHHLTRAADRLRGPPLRSGPAVQGLQVTGLKVAVVTGASSGIGAELIRTLKARGWQTVGLSRRPSEADEHEECDVADRGSVDAAAQRVLERHPGIDLLVNNAGVAARGSFLTAGPERIEQVMRVNYLGSVWTLLAFLPGLGRGSHLVNIVSVAGTVAAGPYSASKHAQLAFSRSITVELAPQGISVHTVNPGFVETEGFPQGKRHGPLLGRLVVEPQLVVDRLLDAVASNKREIYVPRWYRPAAWVQSLAPGALARLRSR